jgi:hypothetical protein
MVSTPHKIGVCLLLGLLLGSSGCDPGLEPLAPVKGRVFYQGVPLHTGTIVFTPDAARGGSGPMSQAEIRSDGTFVLQAADKPGAVVGWHRVTIVAVDVPLRSGGETQFTIPRSLLPDKYRDPDSSGLSCEVKAGRENAIDFNLQ